jgi:shikimate kinase
MNIVLIGNRCSGKTTVGKLLADRTNMVFRDTDSLVEALAGTSIEDLVAERGWEIFRALEKQAIAAVAAQDRQVIATGGGAVEDPENARTLADRAFVVWLDGRSDVLQGRMKAQQQTGKIRPSLTGSDALKELAQIMEIRRPTYEKVSVLRVDTSDLSAAEVSESIMGEWNQKKEGLSCGR